MLVQGYQSLLWTITSKMEIKQRNVSNSFSVLESVNGLVCQMCRLTRNRPNSVTPSSHRGISLPLLCFMLCGILLGLFSPASGFNLDVDTPDIRTGETGSMFGYDVAQHKDQSEGW